MEQKQFIEASCTNNIHAGGKVFRSCYTFEGLWVAYFQTELKNCGIF